MEKVATQKEHSEATCVFCSSRRLPEASDCGGAEDASCAVRQQCQPGVQSCIVFQCSDELQVAEKQPRHDRC